MFTGHGSGGPVAATIEAAVAQPHVRWTPLMPDARVLEMNRFAVWMLTAVSCLAVSACDELRPSAAKSPTPAAMPVDSPPAVQGYEPHYMWWVNAQFVPRDTALFGIPVHTFAADWARASVLTLAMLPAGAASDPSSLADSTTAGFIRLDDFNADGVLDRAITGVFETREGYFGRFLAILSPAHDAMPQVAYLLRADGEPGFSVLRYSPGELIWQSCMECDDLNRLKWGGGAYSMSYEGPPEDADADVQGIPADTSGRAVASE
jgi:hypothetical protein